MMKYERKIINYMDINDSLNVSKIMEDLKINKESFSQYRSNLLKKGILMSTNWGKLDFTLPRFNEYVKLQIDFL